MTLDGKRGFGNMSPERQREIASKGGKAAHEKGTAHEWTSDAAREAGAKGGRRMHENKRKRKAEAATGEA